MAADDSTSPDTPQHLETAIQNLADIHARHAGVVTEGQLGIERMTRSIGRPWFAFVVLLFVATWIALNVGLAVAGRRPFDPPQFFWLQGIVSLSSLLMATFILITENRQSDLAERRAQTTLQIALVSDQKIAKIIELLQKLRQDSPQVRNLRDKEAEAMADPTDVNAAVDRLEEAQDEALRKSDAPP